MKETDEGKYNKIKIFITQSEKGIYIVQFLLAILILLNSFNYLINIILVYLFIVIKQMRSLNQKSVGKNIILAIIIAGVVFLVASCLSIGVLIFINVFIRKG